MPIDPCVPSPCGSNSQCQNNGGTPACSCLSTFIGMPPNCRPECVINSECPSNQACIRERCRDPCPGSCGAGAQCHVLNHILVCTCQQGYTGDPFTRCFPKPLPCKQHHYSSAHCYTLIFLFHCVHKKPCNAKLLFTLIFTAIETVKDDPCDPSPCGPNAQCLNGICTCQNQFQGDPYSACRPECVLSTECARNRACIRNKCMDPCPGTCGQNAQCDVVNHISICSCPQGYTGNPFVNCRLLPCKHVISYFT